MTDKESQPPQASAAKGRKPSLQSTTQSEQEAWKCQQCNNVFRKKTDKVLECDYCSNHYCIGCLNMPASLYNHLSNRPDIKWFCNDCNATVEKNLKVDREIEEKCRLFMQQFEDRVVKLEEKTENMVTVDIVKQVVQDEIGNTRPTGEGQGNVVSETVKEMNERDKRKNNVIFYNMPEPNTNIKEDKSKQDKAKVTELAHKIDVNLTSDSIEKLTRIGKKLEGENKHRPLLVTLKDDSTKKKLFKNFGKLRDEGTSDQENIAINHDMTPKEREELTALKEKAQEKENKSEGKFIYRVRGPPWARYIKKIQVN